MARKKAICVDFIESCIVYNKLNTISSIAISGIESICRYWKLNSIYNVIDGRFTIPSKKLSEKSLLQDVLQNTIPSLKLIDSAAIQQKSRLQN